MTLGNSRQINSNQKAVHDNLAKVVDRHIKSQYKKPFQAHNLEAFNQMQSSISEFSGDGLILDSCCGTGLSTRALAAQFPTKLVIGIDQSFVRLNKKEQSCLPNNALLLQANCEDIWRLCVRESILFDRHYILYPNPWPKLNQLKRRWHGHPSFPYLASLSNCLEVRSNWPIYIEEFAIAWAQLPYVSIQYSSFKPDKYLTLFEKKYDQSGHDLYKLRIKIKK